MRAKNVLWMVFLLVQDTLCDEQVQIAKHITDISNIGLNIVYGVCSNGVGCSDCQFCPDGLRCSTCQQLVLDLPTTSSPSVTPTNVPSNKPSRRPTKLPTSKPSFKPSTPTLYPTLYAYYYHPSQLPSTITPTSTSIPTYVPTSEVPTMIPTIFSISPTSIRPSSKPLIMSTRSPSSIPSKIPSAAPTYYYGYPPTLKPTKVPFIAILSPSLSQSRNPSSKPTLTPTRRFRISQLPTSSPTYYYGTSYPSNRPVTVPTIVPSNKPIAGTSSPTASFSYVYLGCYGDKTGVRALEVNLGTVSSINACYKRVVADTLINYKYFGLQYGSECWASNDYTSATLYGVCGSARCKGATPDCVCTMKCTNGIDDCGGANSNALYQVSNVALNLPSSAPVNKPTAQPVIPAPTTQPVIAAAVPTKMPVNPTLVPSNQPVIPAPTTQPVIAAAVPTKMPVNPTLVPSNQPVIPAPTTQPVIAAAVPTKMPVNPTLVSSNQPVIPAPTAQPVIAAVVPTKMPVNPTLVPSNQPVTSAPTTQPVIPPVVPSFQPVVASTNTPSNIPSKSPIYPTVSPSALPLIITNAPTNRPVITSPTAQASPTIQLPYAYLGCYGDNVVRAMQVSVGYASSIYVCYNLSVAAKFEYFGLQYGGECWASNDYTSATQYGVCGSAGCTGATPDCVCTMKCTNGIDDCGGANSNALYKVLDLSPTHTPTYIPTSTPTFSPTYKPTTYSPTFFPTHAPTGVTEASFTVTQLISNVSVTSSVTAEGLSANDELVLITTIFNVTKGITFKQIVTILNTTYIEVDIPVTNPNTTTITNTTNKLIVTMTASTILRKRRLSALVLPNLLVTYNIYYKYQPDIYNGTVLYNEYKDHISSSISDGSFTYDLQNNAATIMPYISTTTTTTSTTTTATTAARDRIADRTTTHRQLLLSSSVFGYSYCDTAATFGKLFINGDEQPPVTINKKSSSPSTKTALIVSVVMVFVILILCVLVGLFCYRDTQKVYRSKKELRPEYGTGRYDPDDDKLSDDESEYYPPPAYSSINRQNPAERRDSFVSEASRKTFDRPITIADSSEEGVKVNNNPLVDRMRMNSIPPPPQSPPSSSSSAALRNRTDSHLQSEYNSNFSVSRNKMANQEVEWSHKDYNNSNNDDGQSQQSDKKSLKEKMAKLRQQRESKQPTGQMY